MTVGVDVDRSDANGAGEGRFARPVPVPDWEERQELRALRLEADRYRALADLLQRELERVTQSREEFDVLAEVGEARQAEIAELEQRLADAEAALAAARGERDGAPAGGLPAAHPQAAAGAGLFGRFERVRAGVQRAASTATTAAENHRLTTEVAALRQELDRRAEALQAARSEAAAAQAEADRAAAGARTAVADADKARADADAARAQAGTAREAAEAARADAEAAREESAALRAELETVANALAAQAPGDGAVAVEPDHPHGHGRRLVTALVALGLLALAAVVAVLMLTGYGAYCSGHPCH